MGNVTIEILVQSLKTGQIANRTIWLCFPKNPIKAFQDTSSALTGEVKSMIGVKKWKINV